MEEDKLFGCIKPFPNPAKHSGRHIGYGCFETRHKGYKMNRRKLGRYIRKFGFDVTETWNLDNTIMCWLADNVGGFFRMCGPMESWSDYDLDGNEANYKENGKAVIEAEEARTECFIKSLEAWLGSCNDEIYNKFVDFVEPRLDFLAEHTNGYPVDFGNYGEWQGTLLKMSRDLRARDYWLFTRYFFNLWD
jgi:hypothetical protein